MSGFSFWGPLLMTIGGGVVYHLAVKLVPKGIDASLVLVVAYGAAMCASLIAYVALPGTPGAGPAVRPWHPSVIGLGLAAVTIELGYLLAYRAAWEVSTTSLFVNGLVAVLLVPVGIFLFGERMSALNGAGILLCLVGLTLLRK